MGKGLWNGATCLKHRLDQSRTDLLVTPLVVERGGLAGVADTSGATDTVHVLVDATEHGGRQVVIDDVFNASDIKSTGSDAGGDEDRGATGPESAHGVFTLALATVGVNGGAGQVALVEISVKLVDGPLAVAEDERTDRLAGVQEVEASLELLVAADEDDILGDVLVRGPSATDSKAVVLRRHVLAGKRAQLLGECSREHEVNVVSVVVGVSAGHDSLHVLFPVRGEHLVGLIDHGVTDAGHGEDFRPAHQVDETACSGDEDVATLGELLEHDTHGLATVSGERTEHRAVAQAAALVEDLDSKLVGRDHNDNQRLSLDSLLFEVEARTHGVWAAGAELLRLTAKARDDGDKVGSGLSRACVVTLACDEMMLGEWIEQTCLGDGDDIGAGENGRDRIGLNGGGLVVAHLLGDDLLDHRVQAGLVKLYDGQLSSMW